MTISDEMSGQLGGLVVGERGVTWRGKHPDALTAHVSQFSRKSTLLSPDRGRATAPSAMTSLKEV